MKPLVTGPLRQQIYLQTPSQSRTASGQNIPSWTNTIEAWAKVETLSGKQLAMSQASTITATSTHQVTIRYVAGVTNLMRVLYGSRVFSINAVDNTEERNIQIVLTCTEVKA